MKCIVVGGGDLTSTELERIKQEKQYLISADSGTIRLLEVGLMPNLAVGDFDSVGEQELERIKNSGVSMLRFPKEKAHTDLHHAVQEALHLHATEISIFGALGGARVDHALANVGLLEWIHKQGATGVIYHQKNRIRLLSGPSRIDLVRDGYSYVSLIPVSKQVKGITTKGMLYPLVNGILVRGESRGISNELSHETASIEIAEGQCLVIESSD
jgi:thiamine pyrophosphokinase